VYVRIKKKQFCINVDMPSWCYWEKDFDIRKNGQEEFASRLEGKLPYFYNYKKQFSTTVAPTVLISPFLKRLYYPSEVFRNNDDSLFKQLEALKNKIEEVSRNLKALP